MFFLSSETEMLDSRLVHVKTHTRGKGKNKTKQNWCGKKNKRTSTANKNIEQENPRKAWEKESAFTWRSWKRDEGNKSTI